jgi:tRNA threonylcarbamoyl adenosine modification protein YeaZ/ribosomal-protein-alanine acetyltransferase
VAPRRAAGIRVSGLAIECATDRAEVLVVDAGGNPRAHRIEAIGLHHTRRVTPLVRETLAEAGVDPRDLEWVAADLGPGSFTGVRVGLATARALALAAGADVHGASSLTALALGAEARTALIVPLVPAGRRDVYAGFFRADARGKVTVLAAARVGPPEATLAATIEALALLGPRASVAFIGPGAAREREKVEAVFPGSTLRAWRFEGLSALDLAAAARSDRGPAAGLPARGAPLRPAYVRPAQAESRVRHRALETQRVVVRPMTNADIGAIVAIEHAIFTDPWAPSFFRGELEQPGVWARIAEWTPGDAAAGAAPRLAGYLMAWLADGEGHIGNLAVVPELRRHGIASVLLEDLYVHARTRDVSVLSLEVRVSNDAAQALYQAHGFGLAGLRRGYYRDSGEDALILTRRESAVPAAGRATDS